MKSINSILLVGASCCLAVLLLVAAGVSGQDDEARFRRAGEEQTSNGEIVRPKKQGSLSMTSGVAGTSAAASGPVMKPAKSMVSTAIASTGQDQDEEQPPRPVRRRQRPKKPKDMDSRTPSNANGDVGDDEGYHSGRYDDADCDDEDQDAYGNMFDSMAANPMRHFRRMMNSVLDRMPTDFGFHRGADDYDGDDNYRNRRVGDSAASSAASFNSRDGGYSKLASSVTNNGRTRGIISETRNGRTKTRRIGDERDDVEEFLVSRLTLSSG